MVKENVSGKMVHHTKAIGTPALRMDSGFRFGQRKMANSKAGTKATGKLVPALAKAHVCMLTEASTKEISKTVSKMATEYTSTRTGTCTKVSGKTTRNGTLKQSSPMLTATYTKAIGSRTKVRPGNSLRKTSEPSLKK